MFGRGGCLWQGIWAFLGLVYLFLAAGIFGFGVSGIGGGLYWDPGVWDQFLGFYEGLVSYGCCAGVAGFGWGMAGVVLNCFWEVDF